MLDLHSGEERELFRGDSNVEYSRDHLFFVRDGTLMARPFSAKRLELRGDAFPVAEEMWAWAHVHINKNIAGGAVAPQAPDVANVLSQNVAAFLELVQLRAELSALHRVLR